MATKTRPDIRMITRLVPPSGNLVQGQSELAISPALAEAASELIFESRHHYGPAEGVSELRNRQDYPLRAIIACSPANPTGKVFTESELEMIAAACQEFDLLCIADEVYEHYVIGERTHISIANLKGMWERTITVNSFSKSW